MFIWSAGLTPGAASARSNTGAINDRLELQTEEARAGRYAFGRDHPDPDADGVAILASHRKGAVMLKCKGIYDPGWAVLKKGNSSHVIYGHWAAFYRMMVNWDGEEKATEEFLSIFENPDLALMQLEKSAYLSPQVSTRL